VITLKAKTRSRAEITLPAAGFLAAVMIGAMVWALTLEGDRVPALIFITIPCVFAAPFLVLGVVLRLRGRTKRAGQRRSAEALLGRRDWKAAEDFFRAEYGISGGGGINTFVLAGCGKF
jgi:hypothetical protein